ncbi:aldehyde dehydrogenase family protein [Nocardia sp. NPDC004068]|uniref:aldehyde dehydrogenase family protein n=1 Tax=Nocardia sp. NPDC004068 TaxID=3364303 RepID=UPI0036BF8061
MTTTETPTTAITVPFVVDGKRVSGRERQRIRVGDHCEVVLPVFDDELAQRLAAVDRHLLTDVPLSEITAILHRVGKNWRSDEYTLRRLYITRLRAIMGYSEQAAEAEADWIAAILCSHSRMHDLVELELGSQFVLDEWVHSDEATVRAFPRGLVVHIMPGNVPSSNILSLVRALITKNVSVAKVASGDPVTAMSLALSILDVAPDHPVARAINVVYWPEGDPRGTDLVRSADAVCAWGGGAALEWAHEHTAPEAAFLPFGPKWSFALVGADADLKAAALGAAHDVSRYDQAACFSTQRAYVEEAVLDRFLAELAPALERYEKLLPPRALDVDDSAQLNLARLHVQFEDGTVRFAAGRAAVIVAPPAARTAAPLGRTLIVHPVRDLRESYAYADPSVQTVACAPWDIVTEHRDALARRGVSRFVDLGLSNFFRVGGAHDGLRPLQRLVRFASTEAPARVRPKGMVLEVDQTDFLEHRRYKDLAF